MIHKVILDIDWIASFVDYPDKIKDNRLVIRVTSNIAKKTETSFKV